MHIRHYYGQQSLTNARMLSSGDRTNTKCKQAILIFCSRIRKIAGVPKFTLDPAVLTLHALKGQTDPNTSNTILFCFRCFALFVDSDLEWWWWWSHGVMCLIQLAWQYFGSEKSEILYMSQLTQIVLHL